MIIDAHCHIWEEKLVSKEIKDLMSNALKDGIYDHKSEIFKFDPSQIVNITPKGLVQEMEEAGIDKTVLLALDYDIFFKSKIGYKGYNNYVAGIVEKYPDKFIGFAGIDPRRGIESIVELERCLDIGMTGVKLWPLAGFYPDNPDFYPFYERIQELDVPLLCHTGSSPPHTYMKYNRPIFIDTIAVDFPKIKIIMAHVSNPWTNEALHVAGKNQNVYVDISSYQLTYKISPLIFFQTLISAKMSCGVKKVLFGSDWPIFTPILSQKEWVECIEKMKVPPAIKMMGLPDFTDKEKKMILGENAAKIFGL